MISLKSLAIVSCLISFNALALDHACQLRLGLSPEQREELRLLTSETAAELRRVDREVELAKKELKKILVTVNASKEEGTLAAAALAEKEAEARGLRSAEKLAILFDILTPEQRIRHASCVERRRREIREPIRHPGPHVRRHLPPRRVIVRPPVVVRRTHVRPLPHHPRAGRRIPRT